jgi:phosphoribosylanthranilate isomerase
MALKANVLVENITNLSEARYCAGMGVHFLGFPAQSVDPKMYKDITGWVHGLEMAIELPTGASLPAHLNEYQATHIIFSLSEMTSPLPVSAKWIVRLTPQEWEAYKSVMLQNKSQIEFLLFDPMDKSNKGIAKEAAAEFKIYVAMGENSLTDLLTWPVDGITLKGSDEMKTGLKNYDHLSEVLEKLEVEG